MRASTRAVVLSLARARAFSGFKVPVSRNESNNECCALDFQEPIPQFVQRLLLRRGLCRFRLSLWFFHQFNLLAHALA